MKQRVITTLAIAALIGGSAVTFRLVTGKCPVGCLIHHFRGNETETKTTSSPPTSN